MSLKTVQGQTALIPEVEQEAYLGDLWQMTLANYEDPSNPGHVLYPIENAVIHACKPLRDSSV